MLEAPPKTSKKLEDTPTQFNTDVWLQRLKLVDSLAFVTATLSLLLSLVLVYLPDQPQYQQLMGVTISTCILLVLIIAETKLQFESNNTDRQLRLFVRVMVVLPHPNIFTLQENYLLHVLMLMRLHYPLGYLLSGHANWRSERVEGMYGLTSSTVVFVMKSLKENSNLAKVVFVYSMTIVVCSHALYAAQAGGGYRSFFDCMTMVYTTLTTVGYGGFPIYNVLEGSLLVLTVFIGLVMNALVILTSLKTFFMTASEENSHNIFLSLQAKEKWSVVAAKRISASASNKHSHEHRKQQKALQKQFMLHRQHYKSVRGGSNRTGIIESLACSFRSGLDQLSRSQLITNNLIRRLVGDLRHYVRTRRRLNGATVHI